jgi:hypothetical protein
VGTESAAEDVGGDHLGGFSAVGAAQSAFDVDPSESWGVTARAGGGKPPRHVVGKGGNRFSGGQRRGGDSAFDQFGAADLVIENQDFLVFDQESESGGEAAL